MFFVLNAKLLQNQTSCLQKLCRFKVLESKKIKISKILKKLLKTISDSNLDWKEKQYSGGDVKKKKGNVQYSCYKKQNLLHQISQISLSKPETHTHTFSHARTHTFK